MINILQINLQGSAQAQDLLFRNASRWKIDISVVTEPNSVPRTPVWLSDNSNRVAIVMHSPDDVVCTFEGSGDGYCIARCGDFMIVAGYLSPNTSNEDSLLYMDTLETIISGYSGVNVLLVGDFNARSLMWGCRTANPRGAFLTEMAAALDLRLLNVGDTPTCIRPQGTSVVDTSWSTAGFCTRVKNWRVLDSIESLSDHCYIRYEVLRKRSKNQKPAYASLIGPRWRRTGFDMELFRESASWMLQGVDTSNLPVEHMARLLRGKMTAACDIAGKKSRKGTARQVSWWTVEVGEAHRRCCAWRRFFLKTRKRGRGRAAQLTPVQQFILNTYKETKTELRLTIRMSKRTQWKELIQELDQDPWGTAYKRVMHRLRRSSPSVSETLRPNVLLPILDELFPDRPAGKTAGPVPQEDEEIPPVTDSEVKECLSGYRKHRTAPGPDGLFKTLWKDAPDAVNHFVRVLFTRCLADGIVPDEWKYASLVLIAKTPGHPQTKYRPICLLNDIAKAFERLLVNRIWSLLDRNTTRKRLSGTQFGFRHGLSTTDALLHVDTQIRELLRRRKYVIAISLDIRNAFNSIPWKTILRQLSAWGLPPYMMRILRNYLSNRWVLYRDCQGQIQRYEVRAGVPQGSVIGPLLWILSYNWVLDDELPYDASVVGYADDTLVLIPGDSIDEVVRRANLCGGLIAERITGLGLELAASKTDAILFGGHRIQRDLTLTILEHDISIGTHIKYLGVMLDRHMRYKAHFEYVTEKAEKVIRQLCCLLPNLRGPGEAKRTLYAHMIHSVILYASPVWAPLLSRYRTYQQGFRRVQRLISLRVIRAYRTISYEAATLLARVPPAHLLAERNRRVFLRLRDGADMEEGPSKRELMAQETNLMRRQWRILLDTDGLPGRLTRGAILPYYHEWLDRKAGITHWVTQMLTGHGCFGRYLYWIHRAETDQCYYCGRPDDTPIHMYEECDRWAAWRMELAVFLEEDVRWIRIVYWFLYAQETRDKVRMYITNIMMVKASDERSLQAGQLTIEDLRIDNVRPSDNGSPGLDDVTPVMDDPP